MIYFFQYDLFDSGLQESVRARGIVSISTIFFILWFLWLMLMGYAIVTRQEPRWKESIIYNVYSAVLLLILLIQILNLRARMYRRVVVTSGTIRIDDYDFTEYLGKSNLSIIQAFIHNKKKVTCSQLISFIEDQKENNDSNMQINCSECIEQGFKVSLCPKYRSLYNRILYIKKLFESLEIGTIISPENKMNILTLGWKLRFFDDIRVFDKEQ
ncbi:MAG: hypothetical protein JEY99_21600 [Spirochaetales bacterium]|nr:hypothetical protein [Spirochaetales bacterium]